MAVIKTKNQARKGSNARSRMNFRLAPEIKDKVSRAAALSGADLTEFAIAALSEKADEVIERHDSLLLNGETFRFFLDVLGDPKPKKPSARSLKSAERYRSGKRKGVKYHLAD